MGIPARPEGGVCGEAVCHLTPLLVRAVHEHPGRITGDRDTNSEVLVSIVLEERALGVMDLDCLGVCGFGEEDVKGLQRLAEIIVRRFDCPGAGGR